MYKVSIKYSQFKEMSNLIVLYNRRSKNGSLPTFNIKIKIKSKTLDSNFTDNTNNWILNIRKDIKKFLYKFKKYTGAMT